jgi:hypothetical protein
MRAFFVSEAPRDYGFWGVLWCVSEGGMAAWGDGKMEVWKTGMPDRFLINLSASHMFLFDP